MALTFTWTDVGSQIMGILNDTTYLPDPWEDATSKERENWWHDDIPKMTAQYPRGVVYFDGDDDIDKSYGTNFITTNKESFVIYFYTKEDFIYEDELGVQYKNQALVRYFLRRVFNVLKKTQIINKYHISNKQSITVLPPAIGENINIWVGEMVIDFFKRND